MAVATISDKKYGGLLAKALPKVIESRAELAHFAEMLENLGRKENPSPEELQLEALLTGLIRDYDETVDLPNLPPYKVIAFLMEQRGLKQVDLVPVFGSRSMASLIMGGKREPSKAHIRGLAEFFGVSPAVFF